MFGRDLHSCFYDLVAKEYAHHGVRLHKIGFLPGDLCAYRQFGYHVSKPGHVSKAPSNLTSYKFSLLL